MYIFISIIRIPNYTWNKILQNSWGWYVVSHEIYQGFKNPPSKSGRKKLATLSGGAWTNQLRNPNGWDELS